LSDGARGSERSQWALMVVVGAVAVAARVGWLQFGFTSDEVANVPPAGLAEVWADPETAVNPPLMRALMLLGTEAQAPWVGRGVSLVAGALASVGAVRAGAASGSVVGGLLAGGLLAVHPIACQVSAEARAYGLWTLLVVVYGLAVGRIAEARPAGASVWAAALVSAVLMPWNHYLSVPMVAGGVVVGALAPNRRAALPGLVGLVCASPLANWVLAGSSRRTPAMEPMPAVLDKLLGLGLIPPRVLNNPISMSVKSVTGWVPFWPVVMTTSVIVLLIGSALVWRRLAWSQRVCLAQAVGLLAAVAGVATFQHVRPPVTAAFVAALAPVLGGLVAAAPQALRAPSGALLAGWLLWEVPLMTEELWQARAAGDGVGAFAGALRTNDVSGPRIYVWPSWQVPALYFSLFGESIAHAQQPPECAGEQACFAWGDGLIVGQRELVTGAGLVGPLVAVDIVREPALGSACAPARVEPAWRSWTCGEAP
jgi:hypothetical protein